MWSISSRVTGHRKLPRPEIACPFQKCVYLATDISSPSEFTSLPTSHLQANGSLPARLAGWLFAWMAVRLDGRSTGGILFFPPRPGGFSNLLSRWWCRPFKTDLMRSKKIEGQLHCSRRPFHRSRRDLPISPSNRVILSSSGVLSLLRRHPFRSARAHPAPLGFGHLDAVFKNTRRNALL